MRRWRRSAQDQNLDSFLDILTNTVGVLLFVLLFVTLAAADATILVRTPLWSATEKKGLLFEVGGDRVYFIDSHKVAGELRDVVASLPEINLFNYHIVRRRIENFTASTDNYRVRFVGSLSSTGVSLEYTLRPDATGANLRALGQTGDRYAQHLSALKPDEDYVAFVVRPDGIPTFHKAREIALRRGFQVGWEPVQADQALIFGSGGRAIGIQ
jgi:hypothetical protein